MNTVTNANRSKGRVFVVKLAPTVDGGQYPVKRIVGDQVTVQATVVADGHEELRCLLRVQFENDPTEHEIPMDAGANDVFSARFLAEKIGRYTFTVEAWIDSFLTWHERLLKKIAAEQAIELELLVGSELARAAVERAASQDARELSADADYLSNVAIALNQRSARAQESRFVELMTRYPDRSESIRFSPEQTVVVDSPRARFGAWYELFPRSCSASTEIHGTFRSCEAELPAIAAMGFDVVYLPPVHPIGVTHRKGKNNAERAARSDVGSPWAIGGKEGGHTAIHPQLGTLDDFRHFVGAALRLKLDVALDLAFQCSPDHPYVRDHPDWFHHLPDDSIQYAENPPKKYEDIYPLDFNTPSWQALWTELRNVVDYWIEQGVCIFRVDNPHTKPLGFWEWLINDIKREHPDALFLSEAFTRPALMHQLSKVGFSQSYTYFPWKNTRGELETHLLELNQPAVRDHLRANAWINTPDILTSYLQTGGRSAFMIRLILAATLSANYGVYGPPFERLENQPREPGSEEYAHSEKYEIRHWDTPGPQSLRPLMTRLNALRREHPALQRDDSLEFHAVDNEALICFSKISPNGNDKILVIVNLDPQQSQQGTVTLPLKRFRLTADASYRVHDLLAQATYVWRGDSNYVALDPAVMPAHVFLLE